MGVTKIDRLKLECVDDMPQGRLMQARFIEIHQVSQKTKKDLILF